MQLEMDLFKSLDCASKIFEEGALLFREGETPQGFMWIIEGNACLYRSTKKVSRTAMDTHLLSLVGPGQFVGYKAFMLGQPHQISARTLKKTKCFTISADSWNNANGKRSGLEIAMTRQCIQQLMLLQQLKTEVYMSSVGRRVAQVLLQLKNEFGTPIPNSDEVEIQVNLSRKEMAQLASTIDETFVRHITDFKKKGILGARGRKIVVRNHEKLQALAQLQE